MKTLIYILAVITLLSFTSCEEEYPVYIEKEPEYKMCMGFISQYGTDDPIVTTTYNTLSGEIRWKRFAVGMYEGYLKNAFKPYGKTICIISSGYAGYYYFSRGSDDTINLYSFSYLTDTYADNSIEYVSFLILVCPE